MSDWERRRMALAVVGGFLFLALLLWIFHLRGTEARYAAAERRLHDLETKRNALFTGNTPIAQQQRLTELADERLREGVAANEGALGYRFRHPVAPTAAPGEIVPSDITFLRKNLVDLETRFQNGLMRLYNLELAPDIPLAAWERNASLGFKFESVSERISAESMADMVRKMEIFDRFVELLGATYASFLRDAEAARLAAEAAGEPPPAHADARRHLVRVVALKTQENPPRAVHTAREANYLVEYRIDVTLRMTLWGLERFLAQCATPTPERFHAVLSASLRPAASEEGEGGARASAFGRGATVMTVDPATRERIERREEGHLHYYDVDLTLATLTLPSLDAVGPRPADTPAPVAPGGGASTVRPSGGGRRGVQMH